MAMFKHHMEKTITKSLEGVGAVFLSLIFFLLFLIILNALFPTGTSFKALVSSKLTSLSTGKSKAKWPQLLLAFGEDESNLAADRKLTAVVTRIHKTLKRKPLDAIIWQDASEGALLYDRDAVQTASNSSAAIQFGEGSILQMEERTLVIIRRLEADPFLHDKRSFMVLMEGELRCKLPVSNQKSVYTNIATPSAKVRVLNLYQAQQETEYKVAVNADKTSTISVYKGSVKVSAKGKDVIVKSNQWTRVMLNQSPSPLKSLPDSVNLKAPEDSRIYYDRGRPPHIKFLWHEYPVATGYYFILARDPLFSDIVTKERILDTTFAHGGLKKGIYFWRVSALIDDCEGYFSETRRFQIRQDRVQPTLTVGTPPDVIYYRKIPPKVLFAWKQRPGAKGYQFELAHDPAFTQIVRDKRIVKTKYIESGLKKGTYYWRVSVLADSGEGYFGKTRKFQVVQDQKPPLLEVRFPLDNQGTGNYILKGRTEPGANVFVGGHPVRISNIGEFQYTINLKPGNNVIAVAAVDEANNVSSRSKIVKTK
jgi:hypothetical protein